MLYILGLLAKSGHGKTTVARHLVEMHGAQIRSLAGPMKRAVRNVFGFSDAQLWGSQADKEAVDARYGFSARWLLQRLGTEGLRAEFGEDVHVRALVHGLHREGARTGDAWPRLYVVDDVRFPNDARFVAQAEADARADPDPARGVNAGAGHRGAVLKIILSDVPAPAHAGHASENAVDEVPAHNIAATVVSSRARGVRHMLAEVDRVLASPAFDRIRPALSIAPRSP